MTVKAVVLLVLILTDNTKEKCSFFSYRNTTAPERTTTFHSKWIFFYLHLKINLSVYIHRQLYMLIHEYQHKWLAMEVMEERQRGSNHMERGWRFSPKPNSTAESWGTKAVFCEPAASDLAIPLNQPAAFWSGKQCTENTLAIQHRS